MLGVQTASATAYASVEEFSGNANKRHWLASARVDTADGTTLEVSDLWYCNGATAVQVDREVRVTNAGKAKGVRVEFRAETAIPGLAGFQDLEFFIPGGLYKGRHRPRWNRGLPRHLRSRLPRRSTRQPGRYGVRAKLPPLRCAGTCGHTGI